MAAVSGSGNGHALDAHRGCIDAVTKLEIVGRNEVEEHVLQVAGYGHLADRPGDLAVLDPEPGGAAALVAGDEVRTHTHQVGHVAAGGDVGNEILRAHGAGREVEVARRRRRRPADPARCMPGRLQAELARRAAIEQPGGEPPVAYYLHAAGRHALAVER